MKIMKSYVSNLDFSEEGAAIPLVFIRTHVRSCNNACTFPSPSPANIQEGFQ